MKLAAFSAEGRRRVGIVEGRAVHELALDSGATERGVLPLIEQMVADAPFPERIGSPRTLETLQFEAPLPLPRRNLWCVGRNYRAHATELAASVFKANAGKADEWPIVFSKVPECVVGPYAEVRLPGDAVSSQVDYEAELAVVIGRGARTSRPSARSSTCSATPS
jgi:2-keto-4-pentenoate hydratase/2-oxohepta-3-ene-1,7-dioic acid hydratase in catechol pathway